MRQAITLARKHGETKFRMLLGPEVPINEHTRKLKNARVVGSDTEFGELQIWTSDGGRFTKFEPRKPEIKPFIAPAQPAPAATQAKPTAPEVKR